MQDVILSPDQIAAVLNNAPVAVYVSALDNFELLFANRLARELFMREPPADKNTCYQAAGYDNPCPFCRVEKMGTDALLVREFYQPMNGRSYQLSGKHIMWGERRAHIEYFLDITEEKREQARVEAVTRELETTFSSVPCGLCAYRYDGKTITPVFHNPAFYEIMGYSDEHIAEMQQHTTFLGVHGDDMPVLRRRIDETLRTGRVMRCTYRLFNDRQAEYRWIQLDGAVKPQADGTQLLYGVYSDVSEQVRLEKELAESNARMQAIITDLKETQKGVQRLEQYFQTTVRNLPGGVVVVRLDGDGRRETEFLSDGFGALLSMTAEQAQARFGGDITACIHPADRARIIRQIREFIQGERDSLELRGRLLRADESAVWVKCRLSIAREEDGVRRIYITCNDVTREIEEQERIRQQYKELLLQHYRAPDPNTLVVGHCNVTQSRIEEIIDYTGSDMLKTFGSERDTFFTGVASLIPAPEERRAFLDKYLNEPALRSFQRGEQEQQLRCMMRLPREKRGRHVHIKVNLVAEPDTGDVTGILTITDITDQVISDRILRNLSLTAYDFVADVNVPEDCFTMLAFSRNANAASERHPYGTERKLFCQNCVSQEDKEQFQEMLSGPYMLDRLRREKSYSFTYTILQKDIGERIKRVTVAAADLTLGRVCLARADVTDMLRAERRTKAELEEALALAREANRAKSDFLSAMSHDIRTPMNAIMGMTTLAAAHEDDPARVADCLSKIEVSSRHLLSLINDVLDMSKIESGKVTLGHTQIMLRELVDQLFSILQPQAEAGGLKLVRRIGRIDHPCIFGDALRLNQILINLLGNAVKFTSRGGAVEFTVEELPPKTQGDLVRYSFTVRDTGRGMSSQFLQHLFEPFTRSRDSISNRMEGTGLGLSITKGLIDLMGGEIDVSSTVGEGSTFRVTLEFECCDMKNCASGCCGQQAETQPETDDKVFRNRRFLIAEDNEINAEILCALLELHGARSAVATDGRQAVRAFLDSAPDTYDAILMDVQMPDMNGYEATRAIRAAERPDAAAIPIIAMTANAFYEDVQAALAAGMDAHVAKPIDMKLLRDALEKLL